MDLLEYEREHLNVLRPYLPECMVLLKNDSEFRVSEPCKVALYGNGARNTRKGGTGSGEVNSRYYVNVEQGFIQAGFTVTTKRWLDEYDRMYKEAKTAFGKRIKAEAKAAHMNTFMYAMGLIMPEPNYDIPMTEDGDLAVYVVGRICGEGNDRKAEDGDFLLTKTEIRDILTLNKKYERFLLVLNVGGPVDLTPVMEVKNILLLSQLGVDMGVALADVVLARENPSGRLSTTWSAWDDYCKLGNFGDREDTYYKEGVYVGYRYFDTVGKKALFPFGYGLSFTSFEQRLVSAELSGTKLSIKVEVKNTGSEKGKDVVELYVSAPEGELNQPYQSLCGFEKTNELRPGEVDTVEIVVPLESITSYSERRAAYVLEAGDYVFRFGKSSVDTEVAVVVRLDQDVVTTKVRNLLGDPGFKDDALVRPEIKVPATAKVIELSADAFSEREIEYNLEYEIDPIAKTLTDEQLVYLSIGHFKEGGGITSVIGEASQNVCGAAGETSDAANADGVPTLVMADGPAGIRIADSYYVDKKGKHGIGNPMLEGMVDMMGPFMKFMAKRLLNSDKKGVEVLHQYCTAIPIGTAIAQSFNLDFAMKCGDIVGDEMERFGIHLWLAPALNIHRNVLCGRNFEYYSEDPLVSGKMASAITKGVQRHASCGTTIKHFCANNQETNRYFSNSHVSERAMREIYLKGFEICVKESQPHTIMTSYNLLNGSHTSELHSLNEDILRAEWGFEGFVMTDWVVSMMSDKGQKYRGPEAFRVANAGNDVFMPGSKKEFDNMMESLASGKLKRETLEKNVTRVIRLANRLA